ncbi:MAG: CBS domain-containing protein [Gammaproteobacteria bacterium]|nr:CBS domain-containing protein [Gammaproteobacteria bacterium]
MVSETGDVQVFLSQQPPFNQLSESQLEYASDNIAVAFNKSGDTLDLNAADERDTSLGMLIVRSGSLEIRNNRGELIDRLSSGDYLVPEMLFDHTNGSPDIVVLEDCLYYELSAGAFQSLAAVNQDIAATVKPAQQAAAEAVYASEQRHDQPAAEPVGKRPYYTQYVRDTMSSMVVSVSPDTSIREAARLMKMHNISSLLIKDDQRLAGIITDRDFRIRVLADGVPDSEPVRYVMTSDPLSIDADSELQDAQLKMMAEGVRHLPVMDEQVLVGMISQTDILRANNIEPVSLNLAINRAMNVSELKEIAQQIPPLINKLVARDTRAVEVGKILTTLSDGLTRRLILLAEERYGAPPCDYTWLAFGSQARQELALGSDQDNALLLPNGVSLDDRNYFIDLSAFVNDGLDQCGMRYCPGGIMAKNEKWRMTLIQWIHTFSRWIEEPSPGAVMHSSIFFDMRRIYGNAGYVDELQDYVLKRAQKNTIFLAMLCDNALSHSPPLGFFKKFVLETDGDHNKILNLKKRGTIPIVDIAREYTLSAATTTLNTIDRLHAVHEAGAMSREMAYSLVDAHEFIASLRLEAQGKQVSAGTKVDNYLDPTELSPLVRHQLKDAFNVVRDAQAAMRVRFGGGVL